MCNLASRVCHHDSDLQQRTKTSLDRQLAEFRVSKRVNLDKTFRKKRKRISKKVEVNTSKEFIPLPPNRFSPIISNYVNTLSIPDMYRTDVMINDYKTWISKVKKYLPKGHVYKLIYINLIKK